MPDDRHQKSLTRAELAVRVNDELKALNRSSARQLVDEVLQEIADTFARNESVKLSGFGTFRVKSKKPRIGRNPLSGVEALIRERRVLTFRASRKLITALQAASPRPRGNAVKLRAPGAHPAQDAAWPS